MSTNFNHKRIADPLHGSIGLSELEIKILDTPVFQRLRNIKHLGFASYVYPSADYSRFSHSIGVCHIIGKILDGIGNNGFKVDSEICKKYRLAGLLHDIGHYPFSHVMEKAIEPILKVKTFTIDRSNRSQDDQNDNINGFCHYVSHENLGAEILAHDPGLNLVFTKEGINGSEISSIFRRQFIKDEKDLPRYANIISSDLDADRLDFLPRTSVLTGLPYGSVDLNYLVNQFVFAKDPEGKEHLCLFSRAMKAADHLLISRYYDYHQVAFHKAVIGFECLFIDIVRHLLGENLNCDREYLIGLIKNSEWQNFDDCSMIALIREVFKKTNDGFLKRKIYALLNRIPYSCVAECEFVGDDQNRDRWETTFVKERSQVEERIEEWSEFFKIDKQLWHVWSKPTEKLTKCGSRFTYEETQAPGDREGEVDRLVRIIRKSDGMCRPIIKTENSLLSLLSNCRVYGFRVYVLIPENMDRLQTARKIGEKIRNDVKSIYWL